VVDDLQVGGHEDTVRLRLADQDLRLGKSYEVRTSVLQQPSAFSIRLGWSANAAELLSKFPPNTPFELKIGRSKIMSGVTYGRSQPSAERTEIEIKGRGYLSRLYDDEVEDDKKYTEKTYYALTRKVLDEAGLTEQADKFKLIDNNDGNREVVTQVPVKGRKKQAVRQVETGATSGTGELVYQTIEGKVGKKRIEILNEAYKLAGLFLWETGDGNFVLSRPTADLAPGYAINRARGKLREQGDVIACEFSDDVTERHARYIVYGKNGPKGVRGEYVDEEMVSYGFDHVHIWEDPDVKNKEQADFVARKACADARRAGWSLSYTVSGHIRPSLANPGKQAVWSYDMTSKVADDILNVHDNFYIEEAIYRRNPQTTTQLKMMRPQDLVWADGQFSRAADVLPVKATPKVGSPTRPHVLIGMPTRIRQSGRQ
jgi:prophage tail gpP-like protein